MKSIALAVAVCVSAATLLWIGYTGVVEWQHAATLVASRPSETGIPKRRKSSLPWYS